MKKTQYFFAQKTLFVHFVLIAVLTIASLGVSIFTSPKAHAAGSWLCDTNARVLIAPNGGSPFAAQLYSANYQNDGTATFNAIGSPVGGGYNALGFNTIDGYLYAIGNTGNNPTNTNVLYQIDNDGTRTNLGAITNLPTGQFMSNGAFDDSGNYYVFSTVSASTLWQIDITTQTATAINLSSSVSTGDFSWKDGRLWGIDRNGVAHRINPTDGTVDKFSQSAVPVLPATTNYGASWTFGNGNIGVEEYTGGMAYQVRIDNPNSATPSFTLVSSTQMPAGDNGDGASCFSTTSETDLQIVKSAPTTVLPNGKIQWTLTVTNNGSAASSGAIITDTIPSEVTNAATSTAGCTITGTTLTCAQGALNVSQSRIITYEADAPAAEDCFSSSATVLANEVDSNTANNSASAQTCVVLGASTGDDEGTATTPDTGAGAVDDTTNTGTPNAPNTGLASATHAASTYIILITFGVTLGAVSVARLRHHAAHSYKL